LPHPNKEAPMDALVALKTRRSIRKFRPDPVPREVIEDIIDCGRMAATGGNRQPWEFVVVTDAETRNVMGGFTTSGRFIAQAPVCITVFFREGAGITPQEDCAAAIENMLLAAHAHGLGTCWVSNPRASFAEKARALLGAAEGVKFMSMVALGYADESPVPPKRPVRELLHWEKF
jgi:nitroreductase